MEITVREAAEDDLPALLVLLDQLRESSEHPDRPDSRLNAAHRRAFTEIEESDALVLLVAEVDKRVVGTCLLVFAPSLSHGGRPWAVLENMVVDSRLRGGGVGRAIVQRAIDISRERGCYKLSLTSNRRREGAHRFYEAQGFRSTHKGFTYYFE